MLLNNEKQDVQINGNFKTSGFKIQASSKAFDILSSNIYTHKVRAVIREISCNAVDSHTAAGNPNPIQVHLPTKLEPHFSVRDFGIGLSDEDVRDIFTTYFCSTKTSSNDFVGALGLGSKSPFCLVDSFTVTSFFNGTKNLYSCYRDENGEPQVALLTSSDTDEHNGVEVSMAVEDRHLEEFTMEAEYVYFYFDQVPDINKQSTVDSINERKSKILLDTDDVCVERWGGWNDVYAVMGGVAYEIPSSISTLNIHGYLKFKMGEISFDAGRESLSLDDKTVKAIEDKIEAVKATLGQKVIDLINQEPTAFKKAQMANKMRSAPGVQASDLYQFDLPKTTEPMAYYSTRGWRGGVDDSATVNLPLGDKIRYFRYQPRFGGRIKEEVKSTRKTIVLLTDQQIAETMIDADALESLDTLPKVERTTRNGKTYQKPVSILLWNGSNSYRRTDRWDTVEDTPTTEKVYVTVNRNEVDDCSESLVMTVHGTGVKIYGVKNAYKKTSAFTKGNWISLADYVEREYKTQFESISFENGLSWDQSDIADVIKKVADRVECDTVRAFVEANNSTKNNVFLSRVGQFMGWKATRSNNLNDMCEEMLKCHPMLRYFKTSATHDDALDHLVDYLNRRA